MQLYLNHIGTALVIQWLRKCIPEKKTRFRLSIRIRFTNDFN